MEQSFLDNKSFILICLVLSVFRIYLEVIRFDFAQLPLTKTLPSKGAKVFHKWGFYMSIGYFVLFAPEFLMA